MPKVSEIDIKIFKAPKKNRFFLGAKSRRFKIMTEKLPINRDKVMTNLRAFTVNMN